MTFTVGGESEVDSTVTGETYDPALTTQQTPEPTQTNLPVSTPIPTQTKSSSFIYVFQVIDLSDCSGGSQYSLAKKHSGICRDIGREHIIFGCSVTTGARGCLVLQYRKAAMLYRQYDDISFGMFIPPKSVLYILYTSLVTSTVTMFLTPLYSHSNVFTPQGPVCSVMFSRLSACCSGVNWENPPFPKNMMAATIITIIIPIPMIRFRNVFLLSCMDAIHFLLR